MKNNIENKWGIIYCPRTGQHNTNKLWKKIEKHLSAYDIEYDHVQSENSSSVNRLMKMMINNGYHTIIIVGGDSALNDAVNSLMQIPSEERSKISLGVIPNGLKNDFAHFWGYSEKNIDECIKALSNHRIKPIDLGIVHYINQENKSCRRYFLNCMTIGLVTSIVNFRRRAQILGGLKMVSYLFSSVKMIIRRLEYKLHFKINSDDIRGKVMTMCIGNAKGYGFTPNAVPYNGFLDVSVVHHPKTAQLLEGLYLLYSGKILNHKDVLPFRTKKVEIEKLGKAPIAIDGRILKQPKGEIEIGISPSSVNFIIP